MAQTIVSLTESAAGNSGVPTNVGTLFAAGLTDQGPLTPVLCHQLSDYTTVFGPRSTVSAAMYDTAEHFFGNGGGSAYFLRVSDNTATTATHVLLDAAGHPTVTVSALTPGVDGNSTYIVVTSSAVEIEDSNGDILETWPFSGSNAALLTVSSSDYVTFSQATGSGFTSAVPAALASTALSGGIDATDITDASYVSALANFPASLGPGTVILPGRTSATAIVGLFNHAFTYNRFAVGDQADATTSAAAIAALTALALPSSISKAGIVVQGRPIKFTSSGATKTIPASAAVAALRAQLAATGTNEPPAFSSGGAINGLAGFTTAYAIGQYGTTSWTQADANAMSAAGLCFFGNEYGTWCLDEYVTPDTTDNIFFEGTSWNASMMLVSQCQQVGAQFKGAVISDLILTALHGALSGVIQNLFTAGVLYGDSADDAASINTASPVNTASTAQAGQLNAQIAARLAMYADTVDIAINVLALTQSVGTSS